MIRVITALTILLSASAAAASGPHETSGDRVGVDKTAENPGESATQAAASGGLAPFSISPTVPRLANAVALSGYDTAANRFRARGAAEGRLLTFLAARIEYEHGPANGPDDRVSLGLRATFLNQAAHGVDLGALLSYQPRDFREEGNVVAGLLIARRFDRLTFALNPLVGSDPEGDDQSLELRFAGLYKASSWLVVGLDSRGRYNLSSDQKRAGHWGIDWDAQAGATAAFGIGPLSLSAFVGPSLLQRTHIGLDGSTGERTVQGGLLAMAGAGASF